MQTLGDTKTHYFLVKRMERATGADLSALDEEAWAGVVNRCRGCTCVESCKSALAQAELTGEGLKQPLSACENRDLMKAMRR